MNKQKGNAGLPIIIAVFLLIGGFFLLQPKTTPVTEKTEKCYEIDPAKSVIFNPVANIPDIYRTTKEAYKTIVGEGEKKYVKIRGISSLVKEEFKWHMVKSINQIAGRDAYMVLNYFEGNCEGNPGNATGGGFCATEEAKRVPAPINYESDPNAFKLLFIDYSDKIISPRSGFVYVEIYLEDKTEVPEFVKKFCESSQPLSIKTIFPNEKGGYLPPFEVKKSDLHCLTTDCENEKNRNFPDENTSYKLFVYEKIDSFVGKVHYNEGRNYALVRTNDGFKEYKAYFVSLASLLALVDEGEGLIYVYSKNIEGRDVSSPTGTAYKTLQLRTLDKSLLDPWGWWSPECKPAIYLYPDQQTKVSVKVNPKGSLTYTDPKYPVNGWEVTVQPDGKFTVNNKNYNYLYYESKIRDSEINKPKEGFVISFNQLPQFYSNLLPKLGLSEKETSDFKEYWEKVLPYSPYYFIGIMKEKDIEQIEPLTINPKPATIIRVRLYFEALSSLFIVQKPEITTPERKGFTIVEWGGLVKVDKNHPFTCSQ